MKIRIDKYLSDLNIGSRKDVKKILKDNKVKVNDIFVNKGNFKIDIDKDIVELDGEELIYEEYIYLMLNKPKGYISATEDRNDKTVLDLVDDKYKKRGIFPAGRLDKDTEGFILLTNDGHLSHFLLNPKNGIKKKYYVEVSKKLEKEDINLLKEPIFFEKENMWIKGGELEILNDYSCYLTISEGKFHQVKRMFSHISNEVTYLKRVQIGDLKLDKSLELGQYRRLTDEEIYILKENSRRNDDIY